MTYANPSFSSNDFELRNTNNKYLSPEQTEQVNLAKSRVNGQLDFLAQMLGWNGANYWGNLPSTVSQKRQLLGGSFGVYDSYIHPRILSVKTWNEISDFSSPRVAIVEVEHNDGIKAGQVAHLGFNQYPILSLTENGGTLALNFGEVDDDFFKEINNNSQLRIDAPQVRPAPFFRPNVEASGDGFFVCKDNEGELTLYPSYDKEGRFPYLFPIFFAGSTYSFDKPVYISYGEPLSVDIEPVYNEETESWTLTIPGALAANSPGGVVSLVWAYASSNSPSLSSLKVKVQNWVDPSDWNSTDVLQNFLGTWGNKGGSLPFNMAFDSLSLHGFDEKNSLHLPVVERDLAFNDIVGLVYAQRARIDAGIPGSLPEGQLWWNTSTGKLAVQSNQEDGCPFWIETVYREAPENELVPEVVFSDVTSFVEDQGSIPAGTICVAITNIAGLSPAANILNIDGTFAGPGTLFVYKQPDTEYWVPIRFEFLTVSQFSSASSNIPYNVPTYILYSNGLSPEGSGYSVSNLATVVTGAYRTALVKQNGPTEWTLFPDSMLRFIANSALFEGPLEGELWWDHANSTPDRRAARIYNNSSWVALNSNVAISAPPRSLDFDTILFYCDGILLYEGQSYVTDDFTITFTTNPSEGTYSFSYLPRSLGGKTKFPTIEISDSLTSSYREDISGVLFSGVVYHMSPNVYDAETPLRLWKTEHLQVVGPPELLDRQTFINPLVADLNDGPASENWQRYFVRLPLDYGRNGVEWQKTALVCEDFAYYGSSIEPDSMNCPPEESRTQIYEELVLNNDQTDYTYVYMEPYLYSTVVYNDFFVEEASYSNSAIRPTGGGEGFSDGFTEAELIDYDPLHNRLVDFSPSNFGSWQGVYLNVSACGYLTGFYVNDLLSGAIEAIDAPIWDASIYKYPPTCNNPSKTYDVDANNYKICYAYFTADASAAEDGFFDPQAEVAWRFPEAQKRTLYLTPAKLSSSNPI